MNKKLMLALAAAILTLGSLTQVQAHRGWGRGFGLGFGLGFLGSRWGGYGYYPGYYSSGYYPYSSYVYPGSYWYF